MPFTKAINSVRNSVCAVLKIHPTGPNQFQAAIVGTAWCIVDNRFLVTANHIFNNTQPRDTNDRFFVFSVQNNGDNAFHVPVISLPLEDPVNDMAIIEIDTSINQNFTVNSVAITFRPHQDGERVLTIGFPAPAIVNAQIDPNLNWIGGNLFLKSHANEGILSAQYDLNNQLFYELNVGWYQGESGGPIFSMKPLAAFSIMQQYRNVNTPHGVVPGPHQGRSLQLIENSLIQVGANII